MTSHCTYELPKVKLRFKTQPVEETDEDNQTIPVFKEYNPTPSIFLERLKMGK